MESIGNTFRNDDEGGERNSLATGAIPPLVWTGEEPLVLNNGNPVEETLQTSPLPFSDYSDGLRKTTIRNRRRILWSQQLQHLQLELSRLEREVQLMENNDKFHDKF